MKPTYTVDQVKQMLQDINSQQISILSNLLIQELDRYSFTEISEIAQSMTDYARALMELPAAQSKKPITPTYTLAEVKQKLVNISHGDFIPLDKLLTNEFHLYSVPEQIKIREAYTELYLKHNPNTYTTLN